MAPGTIVPGAKVASAEGNPPLGSLVRVGTLRLTTIAVGRIGRQFRNVDTAECLQFFHTGIKRAHRVPPLVCPGVDLFRLRLIVVFVKRLWPYFSGQLPGVEV